MYKPVFTVRRVVILILVLTNIYTTGYLTPILQGFLVIWINLLHGLYLVHFRPFSSRQSYNLELFNTIMIYNLSVLFPYYIKSENLDNDGAFVLPTTGFVIDTYFRSLFLIFTMVNILVLLWD